MICKSIKVVFTMITFFIIVFLSCNKTTNKPIVAVYAFHLLHSEQFKNEAMSLQLTIEEKLFKTKLYRMITTSPRMREFIEKLGTEKTDKHGSKNKSTDTDNFQSIDYSILGDIVEGQYLVIKIVDVKQKEIIYSQVRSITSNSIGKLADLLAGDVAKKLKQYHY